MANKSVYSNLDYIAKLPKETFPMTQQIEFSSVAGSLVPVFCDFLHPGEKISGHAEMITRTRELQTASFVDIDEYIEYFFVPANKANMIFGEWFFNIDDRSSVWRPASLPARASTLPNVSYSRLLSYLNSVKAIGQSDSLICPSESMIRLMQHFRYDVYHMFDVTGQQDIVSTSVWNVPLAPFQIYQAIYYDYYRDSLWQPNDVEAYNTDDWLTSVSSPAAWTDARLTKFFQIHQRRQNADYFTSAHPSPLQNATSMLDIDGVREAALLQLNQWLDAAGINFSFGHSQFSANNSNTNILASQQITGVGTVTHTFTGNGGKIGVTVNTETDDNGDYLSDLDSNIADTQNVMFKTSSGSPAKRGSLAATDVNADNSELFHKHSVWSHDVNSVDGSISGLSLSSNINSILLNLKSQISSTSIRTMFALEKLAQITGRAGKHYDDQVLAHYGYKVSKSYGLETQMIGQQHSTVHIGEIVSPTTVPDGSVAGEIVGKGYGAMSGDKAVDFVAPCHGYFMAIYSAVPRRTYTPVGNPKEYSQMYRFDFLQPELMNLGQQPLFYSEFSFKRPESSVPVAGWQWRYMEEKCRVPMAIGALSRFSESDSTQNGALQDWTIQYPVLNINTASELSGNISWSNFQVMPSAFNSIMLLQYQSYHYQYLEGHVARFFDRDPLYHNLTMKLYKTSYMSKFGEPRID